MEKEPPYGKSSKTTEENAYCMIHCIFIWLNLLGIHCYLLFTNDPTKADLAARAKDMDKYLARVKGIMNGSDPYYSYPLTTVC